MRLPRIVRRLVAWSTSTGWWRGGSKAQGVQQQLPQDSPEATVDTRHFEARMQQRRRSSSKQPVSRQIGSPASSAARVSTFASSASSSSSSSAAAISPALPSIDPLQHEVWLLRQSLKEERRARVASEGAAAREGAEVVQGLQEDLALAKGSLQAAHKETEVLRHQNHTQQQSAALSLQRLQLQLAELQASRPSTSQWTARTAITISPATIQPQLLLPMHPSTARLVCRVVMVAQPVRPFLRPPIPARGSWNDPERL